MAEVELKTATNASAGRLALDPSVFEVEVKPHLFHAEVRRQLAKRRRGTHGSKNRSAVSGGGAKPYRQKGTGRARQGTTRAPQWEGGGVVFGPVPRSYEHSLNKKMRQAALRSALSHLLASESLTVVENLDLTEIKTRAVVEILETLGVGTRNVLIVTAGPDDRLERSVRNLPHVDLLRVEGLNVYDLLRHGHVVITKGAVEAVEARLRKETRE